MKVSALLGLGLVAAAAAPARPAFAKVDVTVYRERNGALVADFEGASDDGCVVTQTHILFTEAVFFESGTAPTSQPPTTQVTLDYSNACTGEFFELAGGTTQQSFQMTGNLGKASLIATVPVSDETGTNNANVSINATWTANAPLQRAKSTTVTRDANTLTVDHLDAETRTADVAGPVATVLMLAAGPTAIDLSRFPEGGQLSKQNNGTRTVTVVKRKH
jgi:hypothetical protein